MAGNSNSNRRDRSDDDVQEDQDDRQEDGHQEADESRFSLGNLTRFAAVGLFVVLGTFAVIHSMNTRPDGHEHDHDHAAADDTGTGSSDSASNSASQPTSPASGIAALLQSLHLRSGDSSADPSQKQGAGTTSAPSSLASLKPSKPPENAPAGKNLAGKNLADQQNGLGPQGKQVGFIPDFGLKAVASMVSGPDQKQATKLSSSGFDQSFQSNTQPTAIQKVAAKVESRSINSNELRSKKPEPFNDLPTPTRSPNQLPTPRTSEDLAKRAQSLGAPPKNGFAPKQPGSTTKSSDRFSMPIVAKISSPDKSSATKNRTQPTADFSKASTARRGSNPAKPSDPSRTEQGRTEKLTANSKAPSIVPARPERYAIKPSARIVTSNSGFKTGPPANPVQREQSDAARSPFGSPPKVDPNLANNLRKSANDLTSSAKATAQSLGDQTAQTANNAFSGAQQKLQQVARGRIGFPLAPENNARRSTSPPPQSEGARNRIDTPGQLRSLSRVEAAKSFDPPNSTQFPAASGAQTNTGQNAAPRPFVGRLPDASPLAAQNNNPFARRQVTTPPTQTTNRRDLPSPGGNNGFARQASPNNSGTDSGSMVRSKAALPAARSMQSDLGAGQQTPARSVSSTRNIASPGAMSMPNAAVSTSSPVTTVTPVTRDVPGDRQFEGVQAPALTLQHLTPREIQVNQPAEFQIVLKNVGRSTVQDVRVFDRVPAGTEYLESTPRADLSRGGQLQWNLGAMKPGEEQRIKLQLKPTRAGEIGSVAQFAFASQASMRARVTQPVLQITHQSKPKALIGDDVIFDVVVKNNGDGPARNVLIQEDVPPQLSFRDNHRKIEYDVQTLMPGQARKVRLALKAIKAGKLTNKMFATAEGGLETSHELNMEVVAPTLKIKTDGPRQRYLGRNVTHQFSIANQGTAAATNVEIIAKLPSGLRFVSANNQGTYVARNHAVYWSLASLAEAATAGVELTTSPIGVGAHPIKLETMADLGLKDQAEQSLTIEHLVDVFFDIDDVVDPIEIGSETQHRVQIVNQGTKTATNVQLQMEFPPGLKPTAVTGPLTHTIVQQQIQFQPIASLKPGDKLSFTVTSRGQTDGDHRVNLRLKSDDRPTPVVKEESTRVYSDR